LERSASEGHERAALALDCFAYEVRKLIGAYAAALEGVDVVVLTGGIGENGVEMRERILSGFEYLGLGLDQDANLGLSGREGRISTSAARVQAWVIPTDEERIVADAVAGWVASAGA